MNQLIPTSRPTEAALRRLKRQEIQAKLVPYVSFILTHLALVILLITSFFADRMGINATLKIVLAVVAVLCILCEMIYIITVAVRWHRNVSALLDIQEKQRRTEEAARLKEKEDALTLEQHRNNVLLNERQRRQQHNVQNQPASFASSPANSHLQPQQGFPSFTPNAPQQPAAATRFSTSTPRGPYPNFSANGAPRPSFPQFPNNGNGAQQPSPRFPNNTPPQASFSSSSPMQGFPQFPDNTPRQSFTSAPDQAPQQTFNKYPDNVPQQPFPQYPNNGTPKGFPQFPSNPQPKTPHPEEGNGPNSQNRPWPTFDQR